jgi:allene oxide cyclase
MRTSLSMVVTGIAVAVGLLALSGASAVGATTHSQHHRPGGDMRFTVVEHADTDTVADTGPSGDSLGDLLAFGNPVFDAANRVQVGTDQGSCVRTKVGAAYECSWTTTLKNGSLVVQGPFFDHGDSTLAITGGTGIWKSARGEMKLHARNAAGTAYDFTFSVARG